jgi:CRP-like cAMP-binding protein
MDVSAFFNYAGEDKAAANRNPFLADMTFLPQVSAADWQKLLAVCHQVEFVEQEWVVQEGDKQRSLYVVLKGKFEVVAKNTQTAFAVIEEGSIFGEQAFFDGEPRSAGVRALVPSTLFELPYENFSILAARDPNLGRAILFDLGRILSIRLRQANYLLYHKLTE